MYKSPPSPATMKAVYFWFYLFKIYLAKLIKYFYNLHVCKYKWELKELEFDITNE
jgi:hypothetical protein